MECSSLGLELNVLLNIRKPDFAGSILSFIIVSLKIFPMKRLFIFLMPATIFVTSLLAQTAGPQVKTANGIVEGVIEKSGVHSFKGIPFAAPPVGDLRWK